MAHRQAAHLGLVDDGVEPGDVGAGVVAPVEPVSATTETGTEPAESSQC